MSIYINKNELMRAIPSEAMNARMAVAYMQGIEIIHCKECKYMTEYYDTDDNVTYLICSEWNSGTDYNGYCHYGERKDDE